MSPNVPCVHRDIDERFAAARAFLAQQSAFAAIVDEWCVDDMDDETTRNNGLWPERYALLEGSTILWASSLNFEERFTDIGSAICNAAASIW